MHEKNRGEPRHFVLIGGGLAGGLLATLLGRSGHRVDLYERRSDPQSGNFVGGRSINLALSVRGLHALERVGLDREVLAEATAMRGRMIHPPHGETVYQPYDKDPSRCIHSVGRATLNRVTIAAARQMPNVSVHFEQRCVDVDLESGAATLESASGERQTVQGEALIGVDGAFSAVRRAMQRLDRFDYSQRYLAHGYKELTIPPRAGGGHAMEPSALHIWPRRSFMMIALPNVDGSFTCTLFLPFKGRQSFENLTSAAAVRQFFEAHFADALALMPTLTEDFEQNPTGSMVTVRCRPWSHAGRIVLVGDACHAVVPFYGQGANAAFEDCVVLDECLAQTGGDVSVAFEDYERRRKEHTDTLADLAVSNFVEMRDKTGSRVFLAYKKLDRFLHKWMPLIYTPLYTLVSFTRTPYGDAVRRADWQMYGLMALALLAALLLGSLLAVLLMPLLVVAAGFCVFLLAATQHLRRRERAN